MKNAVGSVQSVALFGGTSDIGLAIVRELVADRATSVVLAARDPDRARAVGQALAATVDVVTLDAVDLDSHAATVDAVFSRPGGIDLAIVAVGALGGRDGDQLLEAGALQLINGAGASSLLGHVARRMRAEGHGT